MYPFLNADHSVLTPAGTQGKDKLFPVIREFIDSIGQYLRALAFIREHKLWKYALIPGFLGLLIWVGIAAAAWTWSDDLGQWLSAWYTWESAAHWIRTLADVLSAVLILLAGLFAFKYILLIAVAPFMSPLSERVERMLDPEARLPAFTLKNMLRDLIRGMRINVRNIIRELILTLILLLLGLIPLFSPVVPVLIYALQSYYAGFGNMDYVFERHYTLKHSVKFVRRHRGMATGNGLVFLLLLAVPVLGVFVAPPLATVAATLSVTPKLRDTDYSEGSTNL